MIALDLTPTEETHLSTVARQTGLAPAELVRKVLKEHLPSVEITAADIRAADVKTAADKKRDDAVALLKSWAATAPTDPEEVRRADAEAAGLMENLNRNRVESGESPLFP